MIRVEKLNTRPSAHTVGPLDRDLPGLMKIQLEVDGEKILSSKVKTGFTHKALEKMHENLKWFSSIIAVDRIDSEASIFYETAFFQSVEEVCNILVPRRAQVIRLILCELNRIQCHLGSLARLCATLKYDTASKYLLRERELILDLFELMTGSRFNIGFLRVGGVAFDITEGFIERIFETVRLIQVRLREYRALMSENRIFIERLSGSAPLSQEMAHAHGVTGPNLRASGVPFDLRKTDPYSCYDLFAFNVPVGLGTGGVLGDAFDRMKVRIDEIQESLTLLVNVAEAVPPGEHSVLKVPPEFQVPAGEAVSRVEGPRGMIQCHIVSDGDVKPARVAWRTPSLPHLYLIPEMLRGVTLQNLSVVLASLDINIAEVDR